MITVSMAVLSLFIILFLFCSLTGHISDSESNLNLIGYCSCPGYTLIYECTVTGSYLGSTIWRGSTFDCASSADEIILLHRLYNTTESHPRAKGACNNGSIVAQGLGIENGTTYISQLNISVSASMIGSNIECFYDSITQLVGSAIISDPSEYFPSPNISKVVDEISRKITFNWAKIAPECSTIQYNILASNCGSCPTTTNHTTATCTDVPTNVGMCTFVVQTIVCGYNTGEESKISVTLSFRNHTVMYITAGILLIFMLTLFSVTLGIFIIRLAKARARRKLNPNHLNQQPITSHQQVGDIYACVSKTTEDDDYATMKIFDSKVKCCAAKPESRNCLYDSVNHENKQTSLAVIDTRKNVAYGQVTS